MESYNFVISVQYDTLKKNPIYVGEEMSFKA